MGLDIYFFKANRKEWKEFSKGEKVDIYETIHKNESDKTELAVVGEVPECPDLFPLGNWRRQYEMSEGFPCESLVFFEFPMERVKELYERYNKKNEDTPKANWCLTVLNMMRDDEILLVMFDG